MQGALAQGSRQAQIQFERPVSQDDGGRHSYRSKTVSEGQTTVVVPAVARGASEMGIEREMSRDGEQP